MSKTEMKTILHSADCNGLAATFEAMSTVCNQCNNKKDWERLLDVIYERIAFYAGANAPLASHYMMFARCIKAMLVQFSKKEG